MRIAIAGFALESVSFLPVLTGRAEFERTAVRGADMIEALADSASVGGGFIEVLRAAGAEIVPLVYTDGSAAGPASDEAFEAYCREICDGLAAEAGRLFYLSLFTGFAYADVPQVGASIVAVADGDRGLAERAARDLAGRLWAARHALLHRELVHGLEDGLDRAIGRARHAAKPVVVLEHADRMCDSTWVLKALHARGGVRAAVPYLWEPRAATCCLEAGEGATVTLDVGGHSSERAGGPLRLTARVRYAGAKSYVGSGPMRLGRHIDLGVAALLEAGGLLLSLSSAPVAAIDTDPFLAFGLDPLDFDLIVLRSKTHFRAVYQDLAAEIVIVDTPDWGPADLAGLPYRKVGSGVFPITTQE